jgi:cob(I)alamin adenosyltransferase
MNGQRADSSDSDQLRSLRHTINGLKSEVEALKRNSGGSPTLLESFTKEMRKAQEALMREVQSKLGSQGELRDLREGVKTVMRKVEDFKAHSSTLESTVKDGYEKLVQAFDLSRKEMRDVEKRLKRQLEVRPEEAKVAKVAKVPFSRTEEALKIDISHFSDSPASSSLPKPGAPEALVMEHTLLNTPVNETAELYPVEEDQHSHIFCSYQQNTSDLYWVDMETEEEGTQAIPNYTFQCHSSVCEGPDNQLYITGGAQDDKK